MLNVKIAVDIQNNQIYFIHSQHISILMTDRFCRYCKNQLTLDNIYPSDHKHRNWICKTCSNNKKQERINRKRSKKPVIAPPQYNPDEVAFKSTSISNHITPTPIHQPHTTRCQMCEAFSLATHTCHLNPPPWPRVFKDDWCLQYIAIH